MKRNQNNIDRTPSKNGEGIINELIGWCEKSDAVAFFKMSSNESDETVSKRAVKGAAAGCKVGYTRHTYMLSQKTIEQIKAVSQFFGITESSSAEQLIQKGLETIESVHGKKAVTLQKSKSLFEK